MKKNKGFVLLVSIYVIIIFAIFGITVSTFVANQSVSDLFSLGGLKALHIAEGGVNYLIENNLYSDTDWSDNIGDTNSAIDLGEGEFDTEILWADTDECTVEVVGYINRGNSFAEVSRTVQVAMERQVDDALTNAIYASGRINLNGTTGTANGGDLVAGADINTQLTGNFNTDPYASITMPSIDWNSLKTTAQGQGNYSSGNLNVTSGSTLNGVYYVEGNVSIADNVVINGSIICRGSLNMNQALNLQVSAEAGYPALMAEGTITGTQMEASHIYGLIYSLGNITLNVVDNVQITGGIITGGRLSIVNGVDFVLTYDSSIQNLYDIGSGGSFAITSWQNL